MPSAQHMQQRYPLCHRHRISTLIMKSAGVASSLRKYLSFDDHRERGHFRVILNVIARAKRFIGCKRSLEARGVSTFHFEGAKPPALALNCLGFERVSHFDHPRDLAA
jgi:hypothetical protein